MVRSQRRSALRLSVTYRYSVWTALSLLLAVARANVLLLLLVGHDGAGRSLKLQSLLQVGPRAGLAVAASFIAFRHDEFFHDATARCWSAAVGAISIGCVTTLQTVRW